ncbi:MAG: nitrate/nitrite transporter NrtS [Leptolyngbyaceae bacterium]|nr:nitrate/nitrite transporter NrtS [Leptolyngbyaceae bacterium]
MSTQNPLADYLSCLVNQKMMPTAFKVTVIVGTVLFSINHGKALLNGEMSRDRWFSAALTYCIPYMVNIHGQYTSRFNSAES